MSRFALGFLLVLLMALSSSQAQTEEITDFSSVIEIQQNGKLLVTETISVIAAGDQIKRGIYRDFPTRFPGPYGLQRRVSFEVLEVLRDGNPEPWTTNTESVGNGVRLYIGNENRTLDPGKYNYEIRYQTDQQLFMDGELDELYWNVTGNGWAFPIARASAQVNLPPGATLDSAEAYTGPAGGSGTDWKLLSSSPQTALLETTAPLAPNEGFTISVSWPKGFVDESANPGSVAVLIGDNFFTLLSLLALLMVFVYYIIAWVVLGRDPPPGVIFPHYEPPKGFTPSGVRFVMGLGKIDDKSFSAAVLQLAVSGALQIVKGKNFTLVKTEKTPVLLPGQKKFFNALLASRKKLELVQTNHAVFSSAKNALASWLANDFEKDYFLRNSGVWLGGAFLSLIPAGLVILDAGDLTGAGFLLFLLSFWTLGVSALLSSILSRFRSGRVLSAIPLCIFAVPFLAGWVVGAGFLFFLTSVWVLGVFGTCAILIFVFYHLLKAPTIMGRGVLDHIEGFKHYLGVAESERLNLQNPPERTPELFEKFLPYALALNVEQRWAEGFNDVLKAANYQPQWVDGTSFTSLGAVGLTSSIGGSMTSAIAASSTAPGSSSGSGGGGSSGGGGGGGGGGGW